MFIHHVCIICVIKIDMIVQYVWTVGSMKHVKDVYNPYDLAIFFLTDFMSSLNRHNMLEMYYY